MIIVRHPITRKARHCRRCLVTPLIHIICYVPSYRSIIYTYVYSFGAENRSDKQPKPTPIITIALDLFYRLSRLYPLIPPPIRHDHHDYISPFPVPCTGTSQLCRPRQTTARSQPSTSTPLNLLDKDC